MNKIWPALESIHTLAFDFDGVFTDNKVYVGEDGTEFVRCDRGDGLAIDLLRAATARGLLCADVFVLSKERNPVTQARAKKLGLACHQSCDDKLEFVTAHLRRTRGAESNSFAGLVYLGNDLNDLPIMMRAGFSVAPADAHEKVRRIASATLPQRGGNGFVRAFVEGLLDLQNMTTEEVQQLLHRR